MRKSLGLTLVIFLAAVSAPAQTSGTITGTVTDASNAVMSGVRVVARNRSGAEARETTSNNSGQYSFPFLPPGEYEIEFSAKGFATIVEKATLSVTERIGVDAVLKPSAVSERIEVSAAGA